MYASVRARAPSLVIYLALWCPLSQVRARTISLSPPPPLHLREIPDSEPLQGAAGGPCSECEPGTFKDTNGTAACTFCLAGKYNNESGASSATACLPCPPHSHSSPGSELSGCLCNAGYFGNGIDEFTFGVCLACAGGRFTAASGEQVECSNCPAGFYSNAKSASTTCLECVPGAVSLPGSTSCECTPGYKDSLNGSFANCGFSESRLQEALIVDVLLSQSAKRPICVPNRFWPNTWSASPTGGWWAQIQNREWDAEEATYRIFLKVLDPAAILQQRQQQQQTISILVSPRPPRTQHFLARPTGRDLLSVPQDDSCAPLDEVQPRKGLLPESSSSPASSATPGNRRHVADTAGANRELLSVSGASDPVTQSDSSSASRVATADPADCGASQSVAAQEASRKSSMVRRTLKVRLLVFVRGYTQRDGLARCAADEAHPLSVCCLIYFSFRITCTQICV